MKDYLIKLGKQAKKASNTSIVSKKKNKVLQDYYNLILSNQLNIIRKNKKDLKQAKKKKIKDDVYVNLSIFLKVYFPTLHFFLDFSKCEISYSWSSSSSSSGSYFG